MPQQRERERERERERVIVRLGLGLNVSISWIEFRFAFFIGNCYVLTVSSRTTQSFLLLGLLLVTSLLLPSYLPSIATSFPLYFFPCSLSSSRFSLYRSSPFLSIPLLSFLSFYQKCSFFSLATFSVLFSNLSSYTLNSPLFFYLSPPSTSFRNSESE